MMSSAPVKAAKRTAAAAADTVMAEIIHVAGKVQGVFYRKYTEKAALEIGLRGTVENLPDGRVQIVAIGMKPQIDALKRWCVAGSPKSKVTGVASSAVPTDDLKELCATTEGFTIKR